MQKLWLGLIGCSLASCALDDGKPLSVDTNELGVTDVIVEHSTVGTDRMLVIKGLDTSGAEVGRASLVMGRVLFRSEENPDGSWVDDGNELTLTVGEQRWIDAAPSQAPHTAHEPDKQALAAFERISAVATTLDNEAGITFLRRKSSTEAAYTYGLEDCSSVTDLFRTDQPNPIGCCVDFNDSDIMDTVIRPSTYELGFRTVGAACSQNAYYGPCGGHVVWKDTSSTSGTIVFWPSDEPLCGYDTERVNQTDWGVGYGTSRPYDWDGEGTEMGGITATCDCTQCVGGVPKNASGGDCTHF